MAIIKSNNKKHNGKNIWVYEKNHCVFAGGELDQLLPDNTILEHKRILLKQYASFTHIGLYQLLRAAGQGLHAELQTVGFETDLPYIEKLRPLDSR